MADGPPGTPSRRPAGPSDGVLMARSVDEPEAFAVLFDRHAAAVHRYLGRRVGGFADDLLSETFLIAFRRRASWTEVHVDVRPWLIGIATNLVHGHVRAEQRRYRALAPAAAEPPSALLDPADLVGRFAAEALRGPRDRGWYLQAQFADGTTFVVQAPESFTQAQVVAVADQVTHTP